MDLILTDPVEATRYEVHELLVESALSKGIFGGGIEEVQWDLQSSQSSPFRESITLWLCQNS